MRTLLPTALLAVLLGAPPASAQCFGIRCAPRGGLTFNVWAGPVRPPVWGYGLGYTFYHSWVIAPPVMPLPPTPGVFTLADDVPTGGGVDLVVLREKLAREREADQLAKGRVDAAVKRGEFVVFEPGKPLPKRAEVPPARTPDAPKPAAIAAKPPADPATLARFHLARGQAAFDAGELGRATERFAAAVATDPQVGEAHFQLAQVRLARGQYAEAVDAIRSGMKSVPDWPKARFRADDLYLTHPKRLAADLADLKAAMEVTPTDNTLAFLFAHHLWFAGDRAKATELFGTLKDKVTEKELVEPFTR